MLFGKSCKVNNTRAKNCRRCDEDVRFKPNLVEVGKAVGVLTETLVLTPQSVSCGNLAELLQVYHVQRTDVVPPSCQVVRPVTGLPEAKAVHLLATVAERSVAVGSALQVKVDQLLKVSAHNLVSIDEDELIDAQWEQDVEEEDFVSEKREI